MNMRALVWSPAQNLAVWLSAWLYGLAPTDSLIGAVTELYGPPQGVDGQPFIEVLQAIRRHHAASEEHPQRDPVVRLILAGPGDPPPLPVDAPVELRQVAQDTGLIAVTSRNAGQEPTHLILQPHSTSDSTAWGLSVLQGSLPAPAWLSPGEADALLSQAAYDAAELIARTPGMHIDTASPRLKVGMLSDFYDTPGLPAATPPRAARLFARADNVAAIIETVTSTVGDHSLDPHLLPLARHIRQARMSGVAYCNQEFAKNF